MKHLLLTVLSFIIFNLSSQAQFISSLSIYPANPTTNDSIYLIANCYFQSGGCNQKTLNYSIMNETIDCGSMHCLGMATFICYDADTFSIGKLPSGNYTFKYNVNAGLGPVPCSPGIVPGPTDSLLFTVSTTSGINNYLFTDMVIGPNPCNEFLDITCFNSDEKQLSIVDMAGKVCYQEIKKGNKLQVSTNNFAPGLYLLKLESSSTIYQSKLFYKK